MVGRRQFKNFAGDNFPKMFVHEIHTESFYIVVDPLYFDNRKQSNHHRHHPYLCVYTVFKLRLGNRDIFRWLPLSVFSFSLSRHRLIHDRFSIVVFECTKKNISAKLVWSEPSYINFNVTKHTLPVPERLLPRVLVKCTSVTGTAILSTREVTGVILLCDFPFKF